MFDLDDNPEIIILMLVAVIFAGAAFFFSDMKDKGELIKEGEYWSQQCSIIEENIDMGFFRAAKNRLKCGEKLVNLDKKDYDRAVKMFTSTSTGRTEQ